MLFLTYRHNTSNIGQRYGIFLIMANYQQYKLHFNTHKNIEKLNIHPQKVLN